MSNPADSIPNLIDCVVEKRYKLVQLLGAGTYGVVYKALDLQSPSMSHPDYRAIKILKKAGRTPQEIATIRREVALHSVVSDHPNVVNLHDAYDDSEYFYIILDYHSGGDLFELVVEKGMYAHNDELIRSAFLSIIDAVQACHDANIAHRDLKPENFLMSKDGSTAHLADFGLAANKQIVDDFCGTHIYMAPECWGPDPYCPYASDVWAVGVILTNMVSCVNPWEKASLKDRCFARYVKDPKYLYNAMPISEGMYTILLSTFARNPLRRITLPKLRQMIVSLDTFFRSTDKKDCAAVEKCFKEPSMQARGQPRATCSNPHVNKPRPLQLDITTKHRSLSPSIPSISSVPSMTSSDSSGDWEDESRYSPSEETSSWMAQSVSTDVDIAMRKGSMEVIMSLADNYLV
ncbi:kinase-like domain-containing protein [Fomes fomentarius]|nr:kinase-like domain-containing protein [Fomes fomentarius]